VRIAAHSYFGIAAKGDVAKMPLLFCKHLYAATSIARLRPVGISWLYLYGHSSAVNLENA